MDEDAVMQMMKGCGCGCVWGWGSLFTLCINNMILEDTELEGGKFMDKPPGSELFTVVVSGTRRLPLRSLSQRRLAVPD